jgi:hypothetical protein
VAPLYGPAWLCRALLGPPVPVYTRAGEARVDALLRLEGVVAGDTDRPALQRALEELGARGCHVDEHGAVRALLSSEAAGAAARLLWQSGAVDVTAVWADLFAAGVQEVTVPVGSGRTAGEVRVRLVRDGDDIVRTEPSADDVRALAARGRLSSHAVAAAAVDAALTLANPVRHVDDDEDEP